MMGSSRKRNRQEMETPEPPKELSLLQRIRNSWEFANLAQWIYTFGTAVKIKEDLMNIEELEMECLKPTSTVLPEIGLAILKYVSSHRGLTPDLFDEYTRRQYTTRAPERNPFGDEEIPESFNDFDIFTKIRVLQQLTQWAFVNPDKIREKMEEQKDSEQTIWRVEPFGWDSKDRNYFVLDDNRLYRRIDPPPPAPPAPKPKKISKKAKAASRASKRRKISEPAESEAEPTGDDNNDAQGDEEKGDNGLGGMIWECLAVGVEEVNAFVLTIQNSKDPNEKILRNNIVENLLPLLEEREEKRKREQAMKERELLNLEKLATAKRSSRIAGKMELQKQEQESRDAERRKESELAMARKEQEKWQKLEQERESRMMTREQRLKEREARRILHEEDLANLSEDSKKIGTGEGRLSERHLKAEMERKKQALKELTEEEDWVFDCICGAHGQIDDGTHSIACDKCNVWQHSKCVGVDKKEADNNKDFSFICQTCKRRAQDVERAKTHPPIKIKINRPGSSSAAVKQSNSPASSVSVNGSHKPSSQAGRPIHGNGLPPLHSFPPPNVQPNAFAQQSPSPRKASPQSRASPTMPQYSPNHSTARVQPMSSPMVPLSLGYQGPYGAYQSSGPPAVSPFGPPRPSSPHVFSSPNPHSPTSLPPPTKTPNYAFINGNQHNGHSEAPQDSGNGPTPVAGSSPAGSQPQPYFANGTVPASEGQRRSSFNLHSPLSAAPVLAPFRHTDVASHISNGPTTASGSMGHQLSSPHTSIPSLSQSPQQNDEDQASVLPSSITGISPTKHSPPRPTTSNGSFGSATPSVLPPVASLSPSPRLQDPTPPIKLSDSDRYNPNGHSIGPDMPAV